MSGFPRSSGAGTASPLTTKGDVWGFAATDARIPIGANGTLLTADNAQALGLKWQAAAADFISAIVDTATLDLTVAGGSLSGAVLDAPTLQGSTLAAVLAAALAAAQAAIPNVGALAHSGRYTEPDHTGRATTALTLNRLYFYPLRISRSGMTFDRIAIETTVAAGAGGVMRMGAWAVADDYPNGAAIFDVTAATDPAAGIQTAVINWSPAPGLYWIGAVPQVSTCTCRTSSSLTPIIPVTDPTGGTQPMAGFVAAVAGALPAAPDPSGTPPTAVPLIWLRRT